MTTSDPAAKPPEPKPPAEPHECPCVYWAQEKPEHWEHHGHPDCEACHGTGLARPEPADPEEPRE